MCRSCIDLRSSNRFDSYNLGLAVSKVYKENIYIKKSLHDEIFVFRWHWATTTTFLIGFLILILLIPLTWMHFVWNRFKDPYDEYDGQVPQPKQKFIHFMYQTSIKVVLDNFNFWTITIYY